MDPQIKFKPLYAVLTKNTLLSDTEVILQRWSNHFEGFFNAQVDGKLELDDPLTGKEMKKPRCTAENPCEPWLSAKMSHPLSSAS